MTLLDSPGSVRGGKPRLLAVDDEPLVLKLMGAVLADRYELTVAADGEEGLRKALASPPDLILTDVNMPRMTGPQLLRRLQQEKSLEDVPVIVLTGQRDDDLRVELLRSGAQDFLNKPFSHPELLVRIANLLRIKQARELLQQELHSRERDIGALVAEVGARRVALEAALELANIAQDRAEKAGQAKATFLALVSHELRTPLTVLRLAVDSWSERSEAAGGSAGANVRRTVKALDRLQSIVEGVIDYTTVHSSRIDIHPERIDLPALVATVLQEFDARIASKGLRVDVEIDEPAREVTVDVRVMRLILSNLIGNAIKYTDAGSLQVRAFIADGLVFTVRDSGRGIDPVDSVRIFEPFEHGESIDNKSTPGVGLGLALVRDLVALLGGRLAFTSEQGVGSTFTVTLPGP